MEGTVDRDVTGMVVIACFQKSRDGGLAIDTLPRSAIHGSMIGGRFIRILFGMIAISLVPQGIVRARAIAPDPTATALARCLQEPSNASTGGQTDCEATAKQAYDLRMNKAYAALTRQLSADAGQHLREAQRAWLAFRDADARAREQLYANRQGTMYVPMAAANDTTITRDRALQLETYLRILAIEP